MSAAAEPPEPSGTTTIQLLGDVAVVRADGTTVVLRRGQPRLVLTLLALDCDRSVSRSEIADRLWPEELPPHWAGAVRGVVSKVRSFLDDAGLTGTLQSAGDGWRLSVGPLGSDIEVDATEARARVENAESAIRGDASLGRDELDQLTDAALRLGLELAPGAPGLWIEEVREDMARLHRRGLLALVELGSRSGRDDLAVTASDALLRADPYSDVAARTLVSALDRSGARVEALTRADAFVQQLADDLGLEPESATFELIRQIRDRRPEPSRRDARRLSPPHIRHGSPMFGRTAEIAAADEAWTEIGSSGMARALIVLGEPGAGKTRLASEIVDGTSARPFLWGRCSPDRRVSFEPVLEAIDHHDSSASAVGTSAPDGPTASERTILFRDLTARMARLLEAPRVWVIEDVHWANEDTVDLLGHLTAAITDLPVLIVITARNTTGDVADMLAETARSIPTRTLRLGGLDADEVMELLLAEGITDAPDLGEKVRSRTGGNPFFIHELARTADADGRMDPDALPDTLRSWIDQRVASLGDGPEEVLAAAAVLGADVDLDLLTAVVARDTADVLRDLGPLFDAGLLVERDGLVDLCFTHALTHDAVVEGLSRTRRHHLHAAAADAIVTMRPGATAAEVAAHLARAGPRAEGRAVPAMLAAGQEALAATAWMAAAQWFSDVLERRPELDRDRIDALIGLGTSLRAAGRRCDAKATLDQALEGAVRLGDRRRVALASLGLVGGGARGVSDTLPDSERAAIITTALGGLRDDDDDLRIPLQLELAVALILTGAHDERRSLAEDALDRARSHGRADLITRALVGHRLAHHGPEAAEIRLAEIDEALTIGRHHCSTDVTISALMARHEDAMLIGDRVLARSALAEAHPLAEAFGHPYWQWVVRTWQTLELIVDGRLDDAEALAFEASALQADHPEAIACLGVNLVDIRLFQGRASEVIDLLDAAAADNPHIPAYRAVLTLCLAESGELSRAAAELRHFAHSDFEAIPDDTNRLLALAVLADVAATVGDHDAAMVLHHLLLPHRDRQVVLNCFGGGGSYWGPVATQLGRLSLVLGDKDGATAHLAAARASAEAFDAPLAVRRIEQPG